MPKLIVSIDGVVIKDVTLAKDRTTLGRRPYNDIVVDNLAISGEHAVLHMIGGDVYLEDLNSTNGTYVNGRAIKKQALEQNDVIEVGKYKIRFLAGATAATESLLPVRPAPPAPSGPIPLSSAPTVQSPLGGGTAGAAAMRVLSGSAAGRGAKGCVSPGDPTAAVSVRVVYSNSGRVTSAGVQSQALGSSARSCIARLLRGASVEGFDGDPVAVTSTLRLR